VDYVDYCKLIMNQTLYNVRLRSFPPISSLKGGTIMDQTNQNELLDLTRQKLDLQTEKKEYNKDINDRIKLLDARIKDLVKE
jgi:hypothetical protein